MEIVGREVSGDQIEEMLENGQWNIFNDNIMSEGKTARSALNQIERRHRDLLELESRITSLHEVFLDVAMLVEEQGPMTDYILNNVQKTDAMLGQVLVKLERAKRHDKNNPFKKLFCGCFPCAKWLIRAIVNSVDFCWPAVSADFCIQDHCLPRLSSLNDHKVSKQVKQAKENERLSLQHIVLTTCLHEDVFSFAD